LQHIEQENKDASRYSDALSRLSKFDSEQLKKESTKQLIIGFFAKCKVKFATL
jgi:hypothetical protein